MSLNPFEWNSDDWKRGGAAVATFGLSEAGNAWDKVEGVYKDISGYDDQKQAEELTKRLGELNATYIGLETEEGIRRLTKEHDQTMGSARASIGASGVKGLTQNNYLKELESQFKGEKSWMEKSKVSRQDIARLDAEAQAKVSQAGRKSNVLGDALGVLSFF